VFAAQCAAQEIKTVAQCRSYRDAWVTSVEDDTKHLSVKVLIYRAEQMMTCGREIDIEVLKAEMNADEALQAVILKMRYLTLSEAYYREAFNRAAWFIENKHLSKEFLAAPNTNK
jgi:hypothetical protein